MTSKTYFYNRRVPFVPSYILVAVTCIFLIWDPIPSRLFPFLQYPPGVYAVYALVLVTFAFLIWRAPTFVRALMRTPAVEFDGETLLVRGWADRYFDLQPGNALSLRVDSNGGWVVTSDGGPSATINMAHIERRESLESLLKDLASPMGKVGQ